MSTKFVRYSQAGKASYGILDGETIQELNGNFLSGSQPTGHSVRLSDVKLLAPTEPSKVIAVGLNYRSHLEGEAPPAVPGIFLKLPTCVIAAGDEIVFPPGAEDVHYEGEMVLVIGKRASRVSKADAMNSVFGVTCGNDVSERHWQDNDMQWFRGKACDTFGPIGPAIATGVPYGDLLLQTRVNGEVRQKQRTSDLIFDVPTIVSFISQYVTLVPGDVIFTGTPGSTKAMKSGDVAEVELEGVGILRNRVH
jgi:2-keto-4-pentenoate hydratase/2-oxohepta-3-ene-1,7-dioic acid hydratase in catechol pathway